jgi:hypothetical protein
VGDSEENQKSKIRHCQLHSWTSDHHFISQTHLLYPGPGFTLGSLLPAGFANSASVGHNPASTKICLNSFNACSCSAVKWPGCPDKGSRVC